jgi:RNA polymerase sigma-70 factor (ECF subfamily)
VALPSVFSQLHEEELLQLIQQLPDGYRIVFNMYAIEGYSHAEISALLGIQESTSRSQLVKARKMLQSQIFEIQKVAV